MALLRRLGARGGAGLVLALVIVAVISIARFASEGGRTFTLPPNPQSTVTVDPTAGDDGVVAPEPTDLPGESEITSTAEAFVTAWLRRELDPADWQAGLADHATPDLVATLSGVDPAGVPATRQTATPAVVLRTEGFAQVLVPLDNGELLLTLRLDDSRWLVDGVDWERA